MPDLSLEAGAACLFSLDDDMILYEKNGTERVVPASTTKLLTALTVLKYCGGNEGKLPDISGSYADSLGQ